MRNPVWTSQNWRFRNDDGTLVTATYIKAEDTAVVAGDNIYPSTKFRIRFNFGDTNNADSNNTGSVALQYRVNTGGGFGSWTAVPTTAGADGIAFASSDQAITDGDNDTTQRLTDITGATFNSAFSEYDENAALTSQTWADDEAEFEFCLELSSGTEDNVYEFRLLAPDAGVPDSTPAADASLTVANNNPIPDTDALAIGTAGLAPSAIVANNVAPTTDALAFTGYAPTRAEKIIEPPTGAINIWKYIGLKLQGIPPTIDVASGAIEREPSTVALTIAEQTPVRVVNDIPVPDKDTLALSGQVPITVVGEIELPGIDTLALSGQAPAAIIANTREPSTVALTIGEQTPVRSVGQIRSPDTDALALSGQAPTVIHDRLSDVPIGSLTIDEKQADRTVTTSRTPDTDTLTLSGIVPTAPVANVAIPSEDTLTLTGAVPTIDVTVTPDKDTLTLSGIVPITVVANLREPDTDALAITGYEPTLSDSVIREPATVALTIDEQTPIPTASIVKEPAIDELALSGEVPIASQGDTREPSTDGLSLSGTIPTLSFNYIIEPSEDTLTLSGKQVRVNDIDIEVPTGAINIWKYIGLKLDGFPPSIGVDVLPTTYGLTLSGQEPVTNITVTPSLGSLTLSGKVPELLGAVFPDTGTLTLQGYPTVDQDTVTPSVGSLTLSGKVPTLKGIEEPSTASLTFDSDALTVDIDLNIEPPLGTLTLSGQSISSVLPVTSAPLVGSLTLAGKVPVVGVDSSIVGVGTLSLSGIAPTVEVKSYANPGKDTLALSGKTPTVDITASPPITIEVGTGSLELFSTVLVGDTSTTALAMAGQSVSVFYRDGVFIENANATTSVPSNYEQCDFSGFRQLPGSLKLTWNKHAVRKKSWEERHPQDTLQSVPERQKGSKRPEQEDKFIDTLYPDGVDTDDL